MKRILFILLLSCLICNNAYGEYKKNPYTRQLDYYESSTVIEPDADFEGDVTIGGDLDVAGDISCDDLSCDDISASSITLSDLTASQAVFTDASKMLVTTGASVGLSASLTDETGTGLAVFNTSPSLVTPDIGAATGTSLALTGALSAEGVCSRTHVSTVYDAFIGRNAYVTGDVAIYGNDITSTGDLRIKVDSDNDDYLYFDTASNISYFLPVDDSVHIIGKTSLVFAEGWFDEITTDNDLTLDPLGNDVIYYKSGTADVSTNEYNSRDIEFLGSAWILNAGYAWTERQPAGDNDKAWYGCASDSDGSNLIGVVYEGRVYTSADSGANWTERQPAGDNDKSWHDCASDNDGSNLIVGVYYGRLYASSNSGVNWTERQPSGDSDEYWNVYASDSDGSNLIAGQLPGRLYTSNDSGANWTERQPAGDADRVWQCCASDADGSNLMAGLTNGYLYTSSDGGVNWTERQPAGAVAVNWYGCGSDSDGSNLIAVVQNGRVWTSSNSGVNWTERRPLGDVNKGWIRCASDDDGSHLIVGLTDYLYTSQDSGVTWTEEQPTDALWVGVAMDGDGNNVLAGGSVDRLYTGALTASGEATRKISMRIIPEGNLAAPLYRLAFLDNDDSEFFTLDGLNQRVGIDVTDPDTKLEVLYAGTQLKLSYDATNYITLATQSDGDLTIDSNKASYDLDFGDGNLITTGTLEAGATGLDSLCVRDDVSLVDDLFVGGDIYVTGDINGGLDFDSMLTFNNDVVCYNGNVTTYTGG